LACEPNGVFRREVSFLLDVGSSIKATQLSVPITTTTTTTTTTLVNINYGMTP
jgi:hypothetical protein